MFLKDSPSDNLRTMLNGWDVLGERAHVRGQEVYLWFAHPLHTVKLSNAQVEHGGAAASTRDWKVVSVRAGVGPLMPLTFSRP